MNRKIFTTITLPLSQIKCDILEVTPWSLWIANNNFKLASKEEQRAGTFPFMLTECILFNGVQPKVSEVGILDIDDYLAISTVFEAMFTKVM